MGTWVRIPPLPPGYLFAEKCRISSAGRATAYSMTIMKISQIIPVIKDQMPLSRFFRNFFVTRNAWGLFHINSHVAQGSGKPKVMYNTKASAIKSAESMGKKYGKHFSPYKCLHCEGYHIGKNRDNK